MKNVVLALLVAAGVVSVANANEQKAACEAAMKAAQEANNAELVAKIEAAMKAEKFEECAAK